MAEQESRLGLRTRLTGTAAAKALARRRALSSAAGRSTAALTPAAAGGIVAGVWGGLAGIVNYRRYRRCEISKRQAVVSTVKESAGSGVAASLGLVASNAARSALLASSAAAPLSFAFGFVVTAGVKLLWNQLSAEPQPSKRLEVSR